MKNQPRKGDGFTGQRTLLIPNFIEQKCQAMDLVNSLFISSMGSFPKAKHHYFQRPNGISQAILIYCTNGKGWAQVRKERIDIMTGDVAILPPDTFHCYGADEENPWSIYWFHLKGPASERLALTVFGEPNRIASQIGVSQERIDLFDSVYETFSDGYSRANILHANLTFHYFLASCVLPKKNQQKIASNLGPTPVLTAIAFMRANLSVPLKLETIASRCNLSTSYFSGLFKKETGYSPIDYFNQLRIQSSCQFLSFTRLRINEIAQQIGIDDPYYFSRLFKKQMGISPLDYRRNVEVKTFDR